MRSDHRVSLRRRRCTRFGALCRQYTGWKALATHAVSCSLQHPKAQSRAALHQTQETFRPFIGKAFCSVNQRSGCFLIALFVFVRCIRRSLNEQITHSGSSGVQSRERGHSSAQCPTRQGVPQPYRLERVYRNSDRNIAAHCRMQCCAHATMRCRACIHDRCSNPTDALASSGGSADLRCC